MRNTKKEFAGIAELKTRHAKQMQYFDQWAKSHKWIEIHRNHYDWWMFPIDAPSSYGFKWTVYDEDIAELKTDLVYIAEYLRGVEILMFAWGWDIKAQAPVPKPEEGQQWSQWPIRLWKAAKSVQLFGYTEYFASMRIYAQTLIQAGENMHYDGRDLSILFR